MCHSVMVPTGYRLHVKRGDSCELLAGIFLYFLSHLSSMHLTQELELFPDHRVTQLLFKEVKNAAELRQNAVDGKINGALVNPTMVSCI